MSCDCDLYWASPYSVSNPYSASHFSNRCLLSFFFQRKQALQLHVLYLCFIMSLFEEDCIFSIRYGRL